MTLHMDKDWAVLQGAFLLADKLCLPSSLSALKKADWSTVGCPVLEALREICQHNDLEANPTTALSVSWIKKALCVVWLKLLARETGEDIEVAWKENPFFPIQNSLPEVNHVVLLEMVKSMAAAQTFANLLLRLPASQICAELEKVVQHVMSSSTTEDDVQMFLEVWGELWKGQHEEKEAGADEDNMEMMFARQFTCLSSQSPNLSARAAKRLKLDQEDLPASLPATDVLHLLLHALRDIKGHVSTTDLCFEALSISLNAIYTNFLIDRAVVLPPEKKLHILSTAVSVREKNNEKLSPELIRQIQRDLCASHTPSQFRPSRMKLGEALSIVTELAQCWQSSGLLKAGDGTNPSYSAFKLEQSVQRVLTSLQKPEVQGILTEADDGETENNLKALLESLEFPAAESSSDMAARVTEMLISHRMEDHQEFTVLFAGERMWAGGEEHWVDCLERNQAAFQQCDTLIELASTVVSKLHSQGTDVSLCRRLRKAIADIFSALSLKDKNKALAAMLQLSSRGLLSCCVPAAVTEGFEQELNMAFNCIIQGRGGESAVGHSNLSTAASLVARVAFQNPEAALKSCCHSGVFNKGAFSLMAAILQQLPALSGPERKRKGDGEQEEVAGDADGNGEAQRAGSLFCRCLQETITATLLSANEKEQLNKFLGLLMTPVVMDGEEKKQSFVPPQEVVNTFVLPNLSSRGTMKSKNIGILGSLQLLHTALSVDVRESSPHWVLDCSPFPLLFVLSQLLDQTLRCWEQPSEGTVHHWSMETKELLLSLLSTLGQVVGLEVAAVPSTWSRALSWLYNKMEELDWTVRFHLKAVWGEHFKNEVPSSLLAVCDLPEQEWSGLELPQYGQGTGLLAWMECCSVSDCLQSTMLAHLTLDQRRLDHVSMFSKGVLVAVTQVLPSCCVSQWARLLRALRALITSGRLHVPFSLEYVDYLPLLDLRSFSCELRLSVLLLRVLQLLCGSSCSDWLPADGWAHVGRLYAHAVRETMNSVRAKLPLPSAAGGTGSDTAVKSPRKAKDSQKEGKQGEVASPKPEESLMEVEEESVPCQEVLFVLSQLFCHVQHIQVMMPGAQCEPLFLCSLEILSHYEAIMAAFPDNSRLAECENAQHLFSTITDNLKNQEMKAVLQQKITRLVSSTA